MKTIESQIRSLIEKAAKAEDKDEAMRFSQAALNAAHAAQVLFLTIAAQKASVN